MASAKKTDSTAIKLPKGFERPSFAPGWKGVKKGDSVQGVLKTVRQVKTKDSDTGGLRVSTIFTLQTEGGPIGIWESTGLRDLHNVGVGEEVYIEYVGDKAIAGQSNKLRLYAIGVRK